MTGCRFNRRLDIVELRSCNERAAHLPDVETPIGGYSANSRNGLPSCHATEDLLVSWSAFMRSDTSIGFPRAWRVAGYLLFVLSAVFVGRILYEETILTWIEGPQMVGFAMVHAMPQILIAGSIGLPLGFLWLLVSLVLLFRRQFRVPSVDWLPIVLLTFLAVMLFIPYETWEEIIVRTAGPGSHGNYYLVQAAAQGKGRFVALLLSTGYDINSESGGTTPLSGASVGGREEMVSLLISKQADVNRKNWLVSWRVSTYGCGCNGTARDRQTAVEEWGCPLCNRQGRPYRGGACKEISPR